jgi:transcriptional regulator with XRE-family HTH domain
LLGKRIKELREEKGITQLSLAKAVNLSQQTIGHYEVGRANPDPGTLNKIADFFGVSIDYLMGRTNVRAVIDTIAAHVAEEGEEHDWTDEELEDIERFKEFVRMKRQQHKK